MRKKTIEEVREYFKSEGCELLENEYKCSHTKMKYRCSCGNTSEISWTNFHSGRRCSVCRVTKIKDKQKMDYKEVKEYFKSLNCKLLEDVYVNAKKKMKYQCSCGNISYMTWSNFKKGRKCMKCRESRIKKNKIIRGDWLSDIELESFELYSRVVNKITYHTYKQYKKVINPENYVRSQYGYHLDHKVSIFEGFKNNVPTHIIASRFNLDMIDAYSNISKHKNSSITIDELLNEYFKATNNSKERYGIME